MRELKFRGMDIEGNWYYGLLSQIPTESHTQSIPAGVYISNKAGSPFAYHIRPETVGQYTGLKDKNGVEIYEGDICKWKIPCSFAGSIMDDGEIIPDFTEGKGAIKYKEYGFFAFLDDEQNNILTNDQIDFVEIIGNIHQKEPTS